jgi:hypothetical protein
MDHLLDEDSSEVDVSSRSAEEFVGSFDICLKKKMNDKSCL